MSEAVEATRLVTFRIGGDLYAADVRQVERVVRFSAPRRVPRFPDWIEGLTEHDGRVMPVVDLRRRLGASVGEIGPQTRLLLLDVDGEWCGMIVDQVLDVRAYAVESVTPPPGLVRGHAGELFSATVKRGDALVVVLDFSRLFTAAERRELSTADASAHV
jgi:purine-binding chemotaxis protein CheW